MKDLISIVLPVYNGARFLKESIDSIISQTYRNWELIIVDDCSTDVTPYIVKDYILKDTRVRYYRNEKNLGLPANLNKGFSLTRGNYLTWTSDDNRFKSTALETMLRVLKKDAESQLVYASYQIIDDKGKIIGQMLADSKGSQNIVGSNVVGACFLYTRRAMELTGQYDSALFLVEDFDFWQRMFTKVKVTFVSDVLYEYRWHADSLTSTKKEKEFGMLLEKMLKKNRPGFGKISQEAKYSYITALFNARKKQGGMNPYIIPYYFYRIRYRILRLR